MNDQKHVLQRMDGRVWTVCAKLAIWGGHRQMFQQLFATKKLVRLDVTLNMAGLAVKGWWPTVQWLVQELPVNDCVNSVMACTIEAAK